MNRKSLAAAAVLGVAGVSLAALQVRAGGDKIVFPENFAKGVMYATVDRPDNKQYREFYINAEAADAVKKGQPLPIHQLKPRTHDLRHRL